MIHTNLKYIYILGFSQESIGDTYTQIYFKELAHAIVEAGKSEIYRAANWLGMQERWSPGSEFQWATGWKAHRFSVL